MTGTDLAAIIVGLISVISAALAGKAARSAAKHNSDASILNTRTQAETEAYNRARKMDVETIERQDKEIQDLQLENQKIKAELRTLKFEHDTLQREYREQQEEIQTLRRHLSRLAEEQKK